MKKILFLVLIPLVAFGQTIKLTEYQYGVDKEFYFVGAALDSGIYATETIQLNDFDASLNDYPLGYYLVIDTLTSASNYEIIGIFVQGKMNQGSWVNVDTVLASDTLNASHSLASAGFIAKGVLNLNTYAFPFPEYRFRVIALHRKTYPTIANSFSVKLSVYGYKRD